MQRRPLTTTWFPLVLAGSLCLRACAEEVLYDCGFEPPQFVSGQVLAGTDGWGVYKDQNPGAATVVNGQARTGTQSAKLSGGVMAKYLDRDYFAGFYFRPIPYDPIASGNAIIEFSVDVLYVPKKGGTDPRAQVELYDSAGGYIGAFSVDPDGRVLGWTEQSPTAQTTCTVTEWNHFGVRVNYGDRTVSFLLNGQRFGTAGLEPAVTDFYEADLSLVTNFEPSEHAVYYDNYRVVARPASAAPQPRIVGYRKKADAFELTFPTVPGFLYTVEFVPALQPAAWSSLPAVQGSGSEVTVAHANPPSGAGYYRVRVE